MIGEDLLKHSAYSAILFLLVLLASTLPTSHTTDISTQGFECYTLYFLNGIVIYNSTITERLVLETPTNITLAEGFTQIVHHLLHYGVEYNETTWLFEFTVKAGENFTGFFISRVEVCSKPFKTVRDYILKALEDPGFNVNEGRAEIPEEVVREFLAEPKRVVVEVVVPEYESWFSSRYNMSTSSASRLGLAVTAAFFVYSVFIKYDPSASPRSIDEVIESRRGDCDDMSRVLVELLNYYGIPATIVYGYTFIEGFNITLPVENVTYGFISNGPHAFTLAYIPGIGWISLDFLAGSFIDRVFIVENYGRETTVPGEAVKSFLELHRAINATQVIAVLSEDSFSSVFSGELTLSSLSNYFEHLVRAVENRSVQVIIATSTETHATLFEHPISLIKELEELLWEVMPIILVLIVLVVLVAAFSRRT